MDYTQYSVLKTLNAVVHVSLKSDPEVKGTLFHGAIRFDQVGIVLGRNIVTIGTDKSYLAHTIIVVDIEDVHVDRVDCADEEEVKKVKEWVKEDVTITS